MTIETGLLMRLIPHGTSESSLLFLQPALILLNMLEEEILMFLSEAAISLQLKLSLGIGSLSFLPAFEK
jgi:hypothetical protein